MLTKFEVIDFFLFVIGSQMHVKKQKSYKFFSRSFVNFDPKLFATKSKIQNFWMFKVEQKYFTSANNNII